MTAAAQRRAARRRHTTPARQSAPTPDAETQPVPEPEPGRRRRHLAIGAAAAVAVFAVAFATTSFAGALWWLSVVGIAAVSVWMWRAVNRLSGMLTATAAVGVAWALFAAASALVAPDCPGRVVWEDAGSCTSAEVGTHTLIGALTPVAMLAVVSPLIAGYVAVRFTYRWFQTRATSPASGRP